MTVIPILCYWTIALWGLFSRRPVLLYLFFAGLPFGALAVVPPTLTAGLTFVPAPMTAMLLIVRTFADRERLLIGVAAALDLRRLGVLVAFWVVALVTTVFMPRLFATSVMVIPMRGADLGKSFLGPTIQNISQLTYLTISVGAVFAFTQIMKTLSMRQHFLRAMLLGATVTLATGLLDLSSRSLPINPLLDLFRTATYNLLVDAEIEGTKRVVGLMPEASSFGSITLAMVCFLYFLRRGMTDARLRDVYSPVLVVLLLVFAWLSTSSATYIGVAVFFFMATVEWLFRFFERHYSVARRRHLGFEVACVGAAVVCVAATVLFYPALIDSIVEAINKIVLQKTSSSSYEERSMWTAVSVNALIDTYGLGVGVGGTRASNSLVSVVSNVGLIGTAFYFGFIFQCLLRRAAPSDSEGKIMISGIRYAFIPPFVVTLLVGTTPDFGGLGALRFGLMTAIGLGSLARTSRAVPAHYRRSVSPVMAAD